MSTRLKSLEPTLGTLWVPNTLWDFYLIMNHDSVATQYPIYSILHRGYERFLVLLQKFNLASESRPGGGKKLNFFHFLPIIKMIYQMKSNSLYLSKQISWSDTQKLVLKRELGLVAHCKSNSCDSLIAAAIKVEIEARNSNKIPIFRISSGKKAFISSITHIFDPALGLLAYLYPPTKKIIHKQEYFLLDFPGSEDRSQIRELYFRYSLFSGFMDSEGSGYNECIFTRALSSSFTSEITYSLLIDRKWAYVEGHKMIFWPTKSALTAVYSKNNEHYPHSMRFQNYAYTVYFPSICEWVSRTDENCFARYEDFLSGSRKLKWWNSNKLNSADNIDAVVYYSASFVNMLSKGLRVLGRGNSAIDVPITNFTKELISNLQLFNTDYSANFRNTIKFQCGVIKKF